jgi:hypothetical protein
VTGEDRQAFKLSDRFGFLQCRIIPFEGNASSLAPPKTLGFQWVFCFLAVGTVDPNGMVQY